MISNSNPYEELMAFQRDTEALEQVSGRLGWDQETVMPAKSGDQRAAERGAMSKIIHARRTDPQIAEWLSRADAVDAVASARSGANLGTSRSPRFGAVASENCRTQIHSCWAK